MKTLEELKLHDEEQNSGFNRAKAEELLTNSQLHPQLHARYSMIKNIALRGKVLLSATAALVLAAGVYTSVILTESDSGATHTFDIQALDSTTSGVIKDPFDSIPVYVTELEGPPEGYPDNIVSSEDFIRLDGSSRNEALQSLDVVELTPGQFATLGFYIKGDTLRWNHTNPRTNKGGFMFELLRDGTLGEYAGARLSEDDSRSMPFRPRMITDTLGYQRFNIFMYREVNPELDSMEKQYRMLNENLLKPHQRKTKDSVYNQLHKQKAKLFNPKNLVPVLVRCKSPLPANGKRWLADAIVWFDATPEFLAALPKNAIRRPLGAGNDRSGMMFDLRSPDERTKDSAQAVFDIVVYPNPVTNRTTTVEFSIHKQESISIDLCDIAGTQRITLDAEADYAAGRHRIPLQLPALNEGVYMLTLRTNKGAMRTEKIVVQK
ncbi:MAG: T9SS type A sorting domain-containing protein [Candidatus Kapabacteria bacterium]|nr:T9SS type A sorting domain-containing protein [Candidatus Kapabacteria bacterium]